MSILTLISVLAVVLASCQAATPEERAKDMVSKMTLAEKMSMM